jgi:hypothetical protein
MPVGLEMAVLSQTQHLPEMSSAVVPSIPASAAQKKKRVVGRAACLRPPRVPTEVRKNLFAEGHTIYERLV